MPRNWNYNFCFQVAQLNGKLTATQTTLTQRDQELREKDNEVGYFNFFNVLVGRFLRKIISALYLDFGFFSSLCLLFLSFLNVVKVARIVFQIYSYEQTTAEMNDQLTTINTNYNHLEEEVQRKRNTCANWKLSFEWLVLNYNYCCFLSSRALSCVPELFN